MFGALAGLAGSIIGGLFAKNEGDENRDLQQYYMDNATQIRAADARKAGIHPLAALGLNAPSYQPVQTDTGSIIGNGIGNFGNSVERSGGLGGVLATQQKVAESEVRKNDAEASLIRAQSRTLIERARAQATGTTVGGVLPNPGSLPVEAVKPTQQTHLNVAGKQWEAHPGWTDTNAVEQRYGDSEIGAMVHGAGTLGADYWWNVYSPNNPNSSFSKTRRWLTQNPPEDKAEKPEPKKHSSGW